MSSCRQIDRISTLQQDRSQPQSTSQAGAGKLAYPKIVVGANNCTADSSNNSGSDNFFRLIDRLKGSVFVTGANVPGAGYALQHPVIGTTRLFGKIRVVKRKRNSEVRFKWPGRWSNSTTPWT